VVPRFSLLDCNVCTAVGDVFIVRRVSRDIPLFEFFAVLLVYLFLRSPFYQFSLSLLALPSS
jgi:hypothetical protein